jgi:hypothetical protein
MRPTFRKLEVKDIGNLERLIAENVEGIEPGLKIVDSRLLLGQAAIDLVGLDAKGSLALIALDFTADEGLLLRVMDAYSWCLEYSDTLRRLYPMAQVSASRPPRIFFIAERLTDSFLRRIKQLSFLEIDCLEFRHLEVNGASVVYFDHVERLRKSPVEGSAPMSVAPAVVPAVEAHVEPANPTVAEATVAQAAVVVMRLEPPVAQIPSAQAPVAPPAAAVVSAPGAPEFQSVTLVTEPAATVSQSPVVAVSQPAVVESVPASAAAQLHSVEATASLAAVDSKANGHGTEWVAAFDRPGVEPYVDEGVVTVIPEAAKPASAAVEAVPVAAPAEAAPPAEPTPITAASAPTLPVWAKPQVQPNGNRPYFFAQATKGTSPVDAQAATVAAPAEQPAASVQPGASKTGAEVDDRPELESLSFPKDGLSRQWLEFLSQLGGAK